MREIWKDIEGYEGLYQISNLGRVKSLARYKHSKTNGIEIILKPGLASGKYYQVGLFKDGSIKRFRINRLVAQAFIPNPLNLPCVNHKDENKLNNHVENLEWCTHKYNSRYSAPKINQYTKDGLFIRTWNSAIEIKEKLNIDCGNIGSTCRGKRPSAGGYIWKYYEEGVI